ncbi:hypothetical protein [Plantactinospora sp. CA-290183]|uniref:hypothetical protein n=1 Tax=Plantactinospora sp. CA-290183 TaxID=3240006 RepID=UPI003D945CF6
MEQRKHWWNGKWGRLARRDVYLRANADQWHVEQRAGGAEGISRFYEFDSEDAAYEAVRGLLVGPDNWRELSPRPPGAN